MTRTMKAWIDKVLKAPTGNLFIQLIRYGFVGGVAFLVDYSTLILFTEVFGLHYLLSATIAFTLGLITNYLLSVSWVFNKRTVSDWRTEFLIFTIIGIIGLGLNNLIMFLCTDKALIHYSVSKIIATVIVFFWNFLARKAILFKEHSK